jgi:hypothetical protein
MNMGTGEYQSVITPLLFAEAGFGVISVVFAFMAAKAFSGGKLASSILFVAIGAILMSIGHIVMAIDLYFHIDVFANLFGQVLGPILFRCVVAISLGTSIIGFYKLSKATK